MFRLFPLSSIRLLYYLRKRLRWKGKKEATTIITRMGRRVIVQPPPCLRPPRPPRDVPPPLLLKCPLSYLLIHCRSWDLIPIVQMRKLRFTGTQSDPTSSWWDLEIQPRAVSWSFFKPLGLSTGHTRHGRQHPNCLQGLLQPLRQAAPGGRGWAPTMTTFL